MVCLMHVDAEAKHVSRMLPDVGSDWKDVYDDDGGDPASKSLVTFSGD